MNWLTTQLLKKIKPWVLMLGIIWIVIMISLPAVKWTLGYTALPVSVAAGVLAQGAVVTISLWYAWGARRTIGTALLVAILGWLVEFLGSSSGVPFGRYHYTEVLQPQLLDVPVLIPAAWLMMLPPCWAVASSIAGQGGVEKRFPGRFRLAVAGLSGLAISAWDLYLDPQMVGWNFWVWDQPGGYFGIPWINFLGWILAGALMTLIVNPRQVPIVPLLTVYTVVWLLQAVGQALFWSQLGPALCGFLGMGGMLLWAYRSYLKGREYG